MCSDFELIGNHHLKSCYVNWLSAGYCTEGPSEASICGEFSAERTSIAGANPYLHHLEGEKKGYK